MFERYWGSSKPVLEACRGNKYDKSPTKNMLENIYIYSKVFGTNGFHSSGMDNLLFLRKYLKSELISAKRQKSLPLIDSQSIWKVSRADGICSGAAGCPIADLLQSSIRSVKAPANRIG